MRQQAQKNFRFKIIVSFILLIAAIMLSAFAALTQNEGNATTNEQQPVKVLFIHELTDATLKPDGAQPKEYILTAHFLKDDIISFSTDKNLKLAGYVKFNNFEPIFNKAAQKQGLNGALVILNPDSNSKKINSYYILNLKNVRHLNKDTLEYVVSIVGQDPNNVAQLQNIANKPVNFSRGLLFIDDICLECVIH